MTTLGLLLLILGLVLHIHVLYLLGIVLLVVGIVLNFTPLGNDRRFY